MKKNNIKRCLQKYLLVPLLFAVFGTISAQQLHVDDGGSWYLKSSTDFTTSNTVITQHANGAFVVQGGVTWATPAEYVDGKVTVIGAGTTTANVGDSNGDGQSSITITTVADDVIDTDYTYAAPTGSLDAALAAYVLSDTEYWTVTKVSGSSTDVAVSGLTENPSATYGGNASSSPIVVRYNGTNWVAYSGSTGFGDFAYASLNTADTDGDGIPNYADADANGDGTVDNGPDTDGDGINDAAETANGTDPNNIDSDNDGIPDGADVDSGATSATDTDGDGITDGADVDNTTATNNTDTDGDGIIDIVDPFNNSNPVDTDGDGIPDAADVDPTGNGTPLNGQDSDGDGISDAADADDTPSDGTTDTGNTDVNGDGIDDSVVPVDTGDTDGDGIPNYADADVDGDGTIDNGTDADGDGVNTANDANDSNIDTDGDGIPDGADADNGLTPLTDTDSDGIIDQADVDVNGDGTDDNGSDADDDGINDAADLTDNFGTTDTDGDGIPDAADVDPNGNSTPLNGIDTDGDGIQDDADADISGPDYNSNGINDAYDPNTLGVTTVNISNFALYPNPIKANATSINFNMPNGVQQLSITMYDVTGKRIAQFTNVPVQTGANSINKPSVEQGMYILQFSFNNGAQSVTKRIIIE